MEVSTPIQLPQQKTTAYEEELRHRLEQLERKIEEKSATKPTEETTKEDNTEEEITLLVPESCYRLPVSWGVDPQIPKKAQIVIDTGAGPNCIHQDALAAEDFKRIKRDYLPRMTAANGNPITTIGTIGLFVRIRDFVAYDTFAVCTDLPIPVLCGNRFNDKYIESIRPIDQIIKLPNEQELPIARYEERDWSSEVNAISMAAERLELRTIPNQRAINKGQDMVRVAKKAVIQPGEQKKVWVTSRRSGTTSITPIFQSLVKATVVLTHGIHDIVADKPFEVYVANFGKYAVTLPKRMKIGIVMPDPLILRETSMPLDTLLTETGIPTPVLSLEAEQPETVTTPALAEKDRQYS